MIVLTAWITWWPLCCVGVSNGNSHCVIVFEEPEDPANRSFFSEIISSISDVKFSHNGRYLLTRDYLSLKVWDLHMDSKPVETYQVHEYLRSKLCALYENDCIFDKFECAWSGNDRYEQVFCSAQDVFWCLYKQFVFPYLVIPYFDLPYKVSSYGVTLYLSLPSLNPVPCLSSVRRSSSSLSL